MAQLGFSEVCKKAGVDIDLGTRIVEQIKTELAGGNTVIVRGFGSLYTEDRGPRTVNTPLVDHLVEVPAERKVKFRTSKQWREELFAVVD
jgi:nucleoid DNA-binding protein